MMRRATLLGMGVALLAGATARADDTGREPSAAEQLMIELLNRTRADPDAEAARQGIDLNEGLDPGTIVSGPREPLAVNRCASQAAFDHTKDLLANFSQLPGDHRGSDGRDPTARVQDAGATFFGGVAENNAWISQGSAKVTQTSSLTLHRNLFRDFIPGFEVVGRGHRKVMLNEARNEVGVAVLGGQFGGRTAAITTYDMFSSTTLYITGVAIQDNVKKNQFFDIGEALPGVTISAAPVGGGPVLETTTWRQGGYSLAVPAGTYTVTARGGGLAAPLTFEDVVVSDRNVKLDVIVARAFDPPPAPGITLTKALAKKAKDGSWTLATKKTAVSFGVLGLDETQLASLRVVIDGVTYFDAAARAAEGAVVKTKLDADVGLTRKLVVKDADRNKLVLDLKKYAFQLQMKALPGFDPGDGDVKIEIVTDDFIVSVTAPGVPNSKGNKVRLGPADGTFEN